MQIWAGGHFHVFLEPLHSSQKILQHKFLFSELISRKIPFQLQEIFSGINFPKMTYHVFACDSENYMAKLFGNSFLGKSHFSYMK